MELEAFKAKHADNLKYLIDPDHPDLGPKNNQFVFNSGRLKAGRDDLLKRFINGALGTENKKDTPRSARGLSISPVRP